MSIVFRNLEHILHATYMIHNVVQYFIKKSLFACVLVAVFKCFLTVGHIKKFENYYYKPTDGTLCFS